MAFWKFNASDSGSEVDKILERPDHTLTELLDESDLLQELLAPNTKLIEYLRSPDVLEEMVHIIADRDLESPDDHSKKKDEDGEEDDGAEKMDTDSDKGGDAKHEENKSQQEEDEDDGVFVSKDETGEKITGNDHNDEEEEEEHDGDEENNHHQNRRHSISPSEDEETRQRHAQVTAEILSAGVWSLTEALMESTDYLDRIWQILDYPNPLDITYASSFTKINENLLEKKTPEMLQYIRQQDNFVERFMRHIDNPPLMDFLLKVISTDKWGNFLGIIDFLQDQKLIPSLISFLGPDVSSSVQSAAADFLKAFVTISANSNTENNTIGPNELSRELVSEPIVKELVRLMLHGGNGLATGVGVVIEIIRKNNSDYDFVPVMYVTIESHPPGPRDPIYLGTLVKVFTENIPKFQELLVRKRDDRLGTTFGSIEPLGFERFKICELFAELLHCSNMTLLNEANGEKVVGERDQERERIKKMIAKARDEADEDTAVALAEGNTGRLKDGDSNNDNNIESGLDSLQIRNDRFLEDEDDNKGQPANADNGEKSSEIKSDDDDEADRHSDNDEGNEDDNSNNNNSNDNNGESNEGDGNNDDSPPSEEAIRANPVVGDQLKIALADNNCITTILEMFFQFPWNNFLHNVVFDICQQVLNGPMQDGFNRFLAIDLFGKGKLTQVICDGHKRCEEYEKEHNIRLGYMGHLTLISEEVVKFTAVFAPESISPTVVEAVTRQDWINYVTHTLVKSREQYNAVLGGERPEDCDPAPHAKDSFILKDKEEDDEQDDEDHDDEELVGRHVVEDDEDEDSAEIGEEHVPKDTMEMDKDSSEDQFSRYMTQQMSKSAGHIGSSDEEEEEEEEEEEDEEEGWGGKGKEKAREGDNDDDLHLTRDGSNKDHEMSWDNDTDKQ